MKWACALQHQQTLLPSSTGNYVSKQTIESVHRVAWNFGFRILQWDSENLCRQRNQQDSYWSHRSDCDPLLRTRTTIEMCNTYFLLIHWAKITLIRFIEFSYNHRSLSFSVCAAYRSAYWSVWACRLFSPISL